MVRNKGVSGDQKAYNIYYPSCKKKKIRFKYNRTISTYNITTIKYTKYKHYYNPKLKKFSYLVFQIKRLHKAKKAFRSHKKTSDKVNLLMELRWGYSTFNSWKAIFTERPRFYLILKSTSRLEPHINYSLLWWLFCMKESKWFEVFFEAND